MQRHVLTSILGVLITILVSILPQYSNAQTIELEIQAPADDTITATMPGCLGMIDLPPATVITQDCPDTLAWMVETPFDTLTTNGGKALFRLGTTDVLYIAKDTCGNIDTSVMQVTVVDSIPPVAVGTGLRSVSLDGSGMAFIPAYVFDGGSEESCFKYYKIKRLVPDTNCVLPGNPNNWFDDQVKFCCTNAGDTIDLIFRVYDRQPPSGPVEDTLLLSRSDDDTVQVIILDKAPPELTCPPDITIECGDHIDFDTLPLPMVQDNCDSISFQFFIETDLDQCGTGEFRRVIVATDGGGQTDTCIQRIFVTNGAPFDGTDSTQLKWPERYVTVYDCIDVPDTSQSGRPIILEDQCSLVSVSWSDDVFQFSRGACSKVIRTWRVLDWCVFDPKVDSECRPDNGCWTFEQIIKVVDTVAPIITFPADTVVDYLQPGCDSMIVILDSATTDECFPGEEIELRSEVDYYRDGSVDRGIIGGDPSGFFPIGDHWVLYYATDECGNTTIDTLSITIKDAVLPTPIAMNGLSTSLIDMGGGMIMVSVAAEQLNASSYDNCSDPDDLKFSFSSDVNDTTRIFDCDSLGVRPVQLWVTDECGNQDFARTSVLIDDFADACPDSFNTSTVVQGMISRHDGMRLKDVEVHMTSSIGPMMTMTNSQGEFELSGLEKGDDYKVYPDFQIEPMKGITTKDVIEIQRHLLGMKDFDDTYKFLAADVDQSGHISARDITTLRKLILGKITELPRSAEWIFIPSNYKFKNPGNPLDEVWPTSFTLTNLTDPAFVGFSGYRLGDIDMSYGVNENQPRSSAGVRVEHQEDGSIYILLEEEMWVEGLQMEVHLTDTDNREWIVSSDLDPWGEASFNWIKEDILRVSWSNPGESVWTPKGGILLELIPSEEGEGRAALNNGDLDNLIFQDGQAFGLRSVTGEISQGGLSLKAVPNPFIEESRIDMFSNVQTGGTIVVRNALGSEVFRTRVYLEAGWNEYLLNEDVFEGSGLYIVEVVTNLDRGKVKLIKAQ